MYMYGTCTCTCMVHAYNTMYMYMYTYSLIIQELLWCVDMLWYVCANLMHICMWISLCTCMYMYMYFDVWSMYAFSTCTYACIIPVHVYVHVLWCVMQLCTYVHSVPLLVQCKLYYTCICTCTMMCNVIMYICTFCTSTCAM